MRVKKVGVEIVSSEKYCKDNPCFVGDTIIITLANCPIAEFLQDC